MANTSDASRMRRLIQPKSVAIVGASPTPGALGASVMDNLQRLSFEGDIFLVNPKRDEIGGRKCYSSVDDLPDGIDVAVLAIPKVAVVDTVSALAKKNCGAAVIFSAGFAEGGEQGLAEQARLSEISREYGILIEGPNCLGLVNYVDGIALTFVETPAGLLGDQHGVGIVSQSGAMAAVLGVMLSSRGLGVSYSISTGNEAALGVEHFVDFLLDDPSTRTIAMIVEQFRHPKRFLELAARAREAGKQIVLLHPGQSNAARASAATHTGAMAGDYDVMRTMVERAGVILADTLQEFGDVVEIIERCGALQFGATAVMTESGAYKALTLDLCERLGLALPPMSDEDAPRVREELPDFVPVSNPLDITAQALVDPSLYIRTINALGEDARFGAIVVTLIQTDEATSAAKFPHVIEALRSRSPDKAYIVSGLDEGANVPGEYIDELRGLGVPYFSSAERGFRALMRLSNRPPVNTSQDDHSRSGASSVLAGRGPGPVAEYEAKRILAERGFEFPKGDLATSAGDAVRIADEIGYPVVLKAQAAALSHKSDAGGVALNLANGDMVRAAWRKMYDDVALYDSSIDLDGLLVEKMSGKGTEMIVGGRRDPDWGPVVMVGFGGVQAEVTKDVKLMPADYSQAEILEAIASLKSAALLHGYRGAPPLDVPALAQIVEKVGRLLIDEEQIAEIDLNPVVLSANGNGAVLLDALLLIE